VVWFAFNDDRPLFAFAGLWTEFGGDRGTKSKPIPGPHLLSGFLTTAANAVVEPIHAKAMPVILTSEEVCKPRRRSPLCGEFCKLGSESIFCHVWRDALRATKSGSS
jgi:hypothetical protein